MYYGMVKHILYILISLCFLSVNAQYEWTPAKVVLKTGASFRGFVKFPMHSGGIVSIGTTKFKYRKNKKSPTVKYGSETLDKVIFGDEQFATTVYQYVPISKNRYVLMELLVSGKANLYTRMVSLNNESLPNGNPFQSISFETNFSTLHGPINYIEHNYQFFVIRDGEDQATCIIDPNTLKDFTYRTYRYFSDCKDIVSFLESEIYESKDVIELVEDYNLICE